MNKQFLFPHWCKRLGFFLLVAGILLLAANEWIRSSGILSFQGYGNHLFQMGKQTEGRVDITINLFEFLFSVGALLLGFSREKVEDEFIAGIRLSSLSWTVFVVFSVSLISGVLMQVIDFSIEDWTSSNSFMFFLFLRGLIRGITSVLIFHALLFNVLLFKNSRKGVEK
ncbi:MAG: hypothetical protein LBS52_09905 [Dysgonamonadaceae bacterium]|jgi:hypothetical protein|nr:hypothetical protein [Dysgonamonadaceae bacterium]